MKATVKRQKQQVYHQSGIYRLIGGGYLILLLP